MAAASCTAIVSTAYSTTPAQPAATVRDVDSRPSSPISGASAPPCARCHQAAAVSPSARTTAASIPAVRATVQPAPMAVSACPSSRAVTVPHTRSRLRHRTDASQATRSAAHRLATSRADSVSSSETHCRAAPAERASPAGDPVPGREVLAQRDERGDRLPVPRTGAVRAPSTSALAAGGALRAVPRLARPGHLARRINRHVRYRPAAARRQLVAYRGELCPR